MTEPQTTEEHEARERTRYRKIYKENGGDVPSARADRFAKFMVEHFQDCSRSYADEWAQRFRDGDHWHAMDHESRAAMLRVMQQSADGTAAEMREEQFKSAVTDAMIDTGVFFTEDTTATPPAQQVKTIKEIIRKLDDPDEKMDMDSAVTGVRRVVE